MENRYFRTHGALSEADINALGNARAAVVGCGGLGGYAIEELARLGIGQLVLCDPDFFEETNLNRQLYSTEENLGKSKAMQAAERVRRINSGVTVLPYCEELTAENAKRLLSGCHVVIDALDSARARRSLASECAALDIPLVHGAIDGWRAQVSVLYPGSNAFDYIYTADYDERRKPASLAFTAALAASLEVCEAVKVITGAGLPLRDRLLIIDLLTNEFNTVRL